jgi:hypothetical protein
MKEKIIPAGYASENQILCTTPGGWSVGNEATVEVTFNGVDYTNANKTFNFFQVDGVYPQCGPSRGSKNPITVYGSGFRANVNSTLFINNEPLQYMEESWDEIKFPLPPAAQGENFTGSVLFETSINAVDFTKFQ